MEVLIVSGKRKTLHKGVANDDLTGLMTQEGCNLDQAHSRKVYRAENLKEAWMTANVECKRCFSAG